MNLVVAEKVTSGDDKIIMDIFLMDSAMFSRMDHHCTCHSHTSVSKKKFAL